MRSMFQYLRKGVFFVFLAFAIVLFFGQQLVKAQDMSFLEEYIHMYDVSINVLRNGKINVRETILYDFGLDQRHGIYRNIPFIKNITNQETGETNEYRMNIDVLGVTDREGNPYMYTSSVVGDDVSLRIGDPDTTITGENTYVISYEVAGAVEYFSDHDELQWVAIGTDWDVPIESATAQVTIEGFEESGLDNAILQTNCYTGKYGSREQICTTAIQDGVYTYAASSALQPFEGLTIYAGFPIGLVDELPAELVVGFLDTLQGKIIAVLLAIAGIFWYILYPIWIAVKWYRYGRDSDVGPSVTAYFDPPKTKDGRELTPAETGTLIDEVVHVRDFTATLVDLARRGHFIIDEREKKKLYLVKNKKIEEDISKLPNFEVKILTEIFDGKDEVKVQDLKLYKILPDVSNKIYDGLTDYGFFPENPNSVRKFYEILTAFSGISFNVPLILSAGLFGRSMPKKTHFGAEEANKAKSLKKFLKSQEHKLEFEAKEYFKLKDTQTLFEKLLPYAVAFGVEKVWMDRFKDVSLQQPDWYRTYRSDQFTSAILADSLNQSFSSIRSSATPTRSSSGASSGFSGGGFSGGGGGGGGGGSW